MDHHQDDLGINLHLQHLHYPLLRIHDVLRAVCLYPDMICTPTARYCTDMACSWTITRHGDDHLRWIPPRRTYDGTDLENKFASGVRMSPTFPLIAPPAKRYLTISFIYASIAQLGNYWSHLACYHCSVFKHFVIVGSTNISLPTS